MIDGDHVRVNTVPTPGGGAFQLGRSLAGVDSTLSRLRWLLLALCVAGTALAAALGRLFSRPVIQPVTDLTEAAEHITATEDLGRRVDARGDDEVGRMAARFNTMLDTLEGSGRGASAGWWPTPRTSCARRSPACAPTSRCCWPATTCPRRRGGGCSRTCASRPRS